MSLESGDIVWLSGPFWIDADNPMGRHLCCFSSTGHHLAAPFQLCRACSSASRGVPVLRSGARTHALTSPCSCAAVVTARYALQGVFRGSMHVRGEGCSGGVLSMLLASQ